MTTYDAIVVGGGIVGCAAASELAAGHEVLLLEKNSIASGATGKASGLVSPVYDHQKNLEAAAYATAFFEEFDGTHHVSPEMPGGVFLFGAEERADAEKAAKRARGAGFGAETLSRGELADRYPEPFDTEQFDGGVVFDEVGWVDSHTVATALQKRATERGATIETGVEVTRVLGEERVTGVRTAQGEIEAPTVVVAAGWRTRDLVADHVEVPVRPFRYQTAELEVDTGLDPSFPVVWEHETLLYWRPTRDGALHVGGRPYFVEEPGTMLQGATDDFKRTIARVIPSYIPSIGDPRLRSDDTCPTGDAATPDAVPILDAPPEAPDGLVVATGMHGFGIMLAPVAGAAVRSLVTDSEAPFSLEPYRLARFDDRGSDFSSSYISAPE